MRDRQQVSRRRNQHVSHSPSSTTTGGAGASVSENDKADKGFTTIWLFGLILGAICGWITLQIVPSRETGNCGTHKNVEVATCKKLGKVYDQVHFVGPVVFSSTTRTFEDCCSLCVTEECVAFSFSYLDYNCMLFKDTVFQALRIGWSRSMIRTVETLQEQKNLYEIAENPQEVRESVFWDIFQTHRHMDHPPQFTIEDSYTDQNGSMKLRKDYRRDVAHAIARHGLTKFQKRNNKNYNFNLLWGLQWTELDRFQEANFQGWQQINMLPGIAKMVLGDKDVLHETCEEAKRWLSAPSLIESFIPKSYILPRDAELLLRDEKLIEDSQVWIWKELNSWSGDGVHVMHMGQAKIRATQQKPEESVFLQKYIENPLTLNGFKFDTRWWALITSLEPLTIFAVPNAYVRTAETERYKLEQRTFDNKCIHITNGKVQKKCEEAFAPRRKTSIKPNFPLSILNPTFESLLCDARGRRVKNYSTAKMIDDTHDVMIKTILMGLPKLKMLRNLTNARCFQLLAFDIIYDEINFAPWVEEVNTNGYLGSGIKLAAEDSEHQFQERVDYLYDMFAILGVNGYSRKNYQTKFEQDLRLLLKRKEIHTVEDILKVLPKLQDLMDQVQHQNSWKLVYPFPFLESDPTIREIATKAGDVPFDPDFLRLILNF